MPKILHKQELIRQLAKKHRRPQEHYQTALTNILDSIQEHLAEGREVILTGFGTFYTRTKKGGRGLNFKTKKPMDYKAVRQAAFRPGAILKQAVRRKKSLFSH
jgi:DNA-binding protein HU-beta